MLSHNKGAQRPVGAGRIQQARNSARQRQQQPVDRFGLRLQPATPAQQANSVRRRFTEPHVTPAPTWYQYQDDHGRRVEVRVTSIANGQRSTYVSYVENGACQHERFTGSVFVTDDDGRYEGFAPWVRQRVQRWERDNVGRTLWYADWTVTTTTGDGATTTTGWHEWRPWLAGGGLVIIDEQVNERDRYTWQGTYEQTMVFDVIWSVALRTGVVR